MPKNWREKYKIKYVVPASLGLGIGVIGGASPLLFPLIQDATKPFAPIVCQSPFLSGPRIASEAFSQLGKAPEALSQVSVQAAVSQMSQLPDALYETFVRKPPYILSEISKFPEVLSQLPGVLFEAVTRTLPRAMLRPFSRCGTSFTASP